MKEILFSFENEHKRGVLRNMFGSPQYWNLFTYKSTDHYSIYGPRNAFNFSNSNYWLGPKRDVPNNLTFCFKSISVIPTGYMIKASSYTANTAAWPKKWGFSGSNNEINWYEYQEVELKSSLTTNESYYANWSYPIPLRCFQLTTIEGNNNYKNRFDVSEFDVFGFVVSNKETCMKRWDIGKYLHMFLFVSLSYSSV